MPYTLLQGGRRRRRRRWGPVVLAVIVLAVAATLFACRPRGRAADRRSRPPRTARARCRTRAPRRWPAAARLRRRWRCGWTTRATSVPLRLQHPPRSGLLFDVDTGRVLWRHASRARAADRVADEDDDRAGGGRPGRPKRAGEDHQGGARLHRLGRRPAAARRGSPSTRCSTGCCCRPATTPRSRCRCGPPGPRRASSR